MIDLQPIRRVTGYLAACVLAFCAPVMAFEHLAAPPATATQPVSPPEQEVADKLATAEYLRASGAGDVIQQYKLAKQAEPS